MATLTYDPSEDTGELSADEKESLEIGEKLETQQSELLAGKYKDAEELEKAYIELQGKLGKEESPQQSQEEPPQEKEEEPPEEDFFEALWNESQSDDKEYSEGIMERLKGMDQTELAQAYLNLRADKNSQPQEDIMSEADASSLKDMVGGQDSYDEMIRWASSAFNKDEIDMYDKVMESGNKAAAFFAVQALAQRFGNSQGVEGEMLKGRAPRTESKDVFKSQAALVRAMADPKYDKDPAYRQEVMEKLERSPIDF
tara:strand:- start:47 stop:814 length:768 start_codon:yes stop_codon:yes gene_type:complete